MRFLAILTVTFCTLTSCDRENYLSWPEATTQNKPGVRWWWMGSAVDKDNLEYLIGEYASKGIGTVEITPIYGVQGEDEREIEYLSDQWMDMLKATTDAAKKNGVEVDMNNGTGWPFGGPHVTLEMAARKLIVDTYDLSVEKLPDPLIPREIKQREATLLRTIHQGEDTVYAVFCGHTYQKVKRAAPGGEGLVIDHFNKESVLKYLARFDQAFKGREELIPTTFFNDSYEVYGADCTPEIFEEFENRRGYKLEEHIGELLSGGKVVTDYDETLSELLLENFTQVWAEWAHKYGATVRNQAHGSPANLIDLYAAVDIPECEGFGLTRFGIKGLREDSLVRENDSDYAMLKWASSGAHITGKKLTSSETFTWLTEHFRTSFSQCKPDLDLMFAAGVNRMFFHGTTYSPRDAEWPGWKFYASMDMSPTNPLWRDATPFTNYIQRMQGMLQMGKPDNDFLVYLPIYDIWDSQGKRLLQLSIHDMGKIAPRFIETINAIDKAGYDVDYISDRYLKECHATKNGCVKVSTAGEMGTEYKAIVLPDVRHLPQATKETLCRLAQDGVKIVIVGNDIIPELAGGNIIKGEDYNLILRETEVKPEEVRTKLGIKTMRRKCENGTLYFLANNTKSDIDEWVTLNGITGESVLIYDAVSGKIGYTEVREGQREREVRVQLKSGESLIIRQVDDIQNAQRWVYREKEIEKRDLTQNRWRIEVGEKIIETEKLKPWTALDDSTYWNYMGTGKYVTDFEIEENEGIWWIDLGDVRETARVKINGEEVGTYWSVPYIGEITGHLRKGNNHLEIEVTNLPANKISHMDRMGVGWRKFKEINIVDINYKRTGYGEWGVMESGLNSHVVLTRQH